MRAAPLLSEPTGPFEGGNHESTQALRRALWTARMVRASRLYNVTNLLPRLYTLDEVAEALRCSRRTALNAATKGAIRSTLVAGRRLVSADEVARIAREGLTAAAAPIAEPPRSRRGRPRKVAAAPLVA